MSHLGYVAATYALAVAVVAGLAVDAWLRMGRARRRLEAVDPRRRRKEAG
jgi:hypothetical protein